MVLEHLRLLAQSFISTEPYAALASKSKWVVVELFALTMVVTGISTAVRWQIRMLPAIQSQAGEILSQIARDYPADLRLQWDGTTLTSSHPEPLAIPYPQSLTALSYFPHTFGYIVSTEIGAAQIEQLPSPSFFVITPTQLYVTNLDDQWNNAPLSDLFGNDETELTRSTIGPYVEQQRVVLSKTIAVFKKMTWVLGPLWLILYRALSALFYAVLAFVAVSVSGAKLPFGKVWQLSMHITMIATVVYECAQWLYARTDFPLFMVSFWLIFVSVWLTKRSRIAPNRV